MGGGVFARLQHTPGIRQWDPRTENWVPICPSIWDQNPRLGPALPAIAIWKWDVSAQPPVGLLTFAAAWLAKEDGAPGLVVAGAWR
jgi:hypothetical protein